MRLLTPDGQVPDLSRRRMLAASMFTVGYAAALSPAQASAIETDAEGLIIEEPSFPAHAGYTLPSYLARPAHGRPAPAIIVVNEIFGIHAWIKDICRRFAKAGYVAVAPDYFDRAGDPSTLKDFAEIRKIVDTAGLEQQMGDTGGAIQFLQAQPFVEAQNLAVTGFCWGGTVVWMAAARFPELKAGAAWYGRLVGQGERPFPVNVADELNCPVLGLYGGKDRGIPVDTVEAMRAALARVGNPTGSEIQVYPDAGHGFLADYREGYDAPAATDAWARTLAWFEANLRG